MGPCKHNRMDQNERRKLRNKKMVPVIARK